MVGQTISELQYTQENCQNDSFDIQAAIMRFVASDDRFSLEFPRSLTSNERREAKLVAEQYPELKCESYGFNNDRRLYLFKRSSTTLLKVKNTFIDGWDANDASKEREPFFYRSMPAMLLEEVCSSCSNKACDGNHGSLELPPLSRNLVTQPAHGQDNTTPQSSRSSDARELVCASPKSDVTRSAPPGVFRYPVGTHVVIQGLIKLPTFNGLVGIVHSLNEETGRYNVLLPSPSGGGQWAKVKHENMKPANLVNGQ